MACDPHPTTSMSTDTPSPQGGGPPPSAVVAPQRVIGIMGAGIGGLVLAQKLKVHGLPSHTKVVILERDQGPGSRDQGYYLGLTLRTTRLLQPLTTQIPELRNLLDDPLNYSVGLRIRDETGRLLMDLPGQAIRVDRPKLRDALLTGLGDDTIMWGKQVVQVEEEEAGVKVWFKDGSTMDLDYLIGADGANSLGRKHRAPTMQPHDLGYTTITGVSPLSAAPHGLVEELNQHLGRWLGPDGHTLLVYKVQTGPQEGQVVWALSYPGRREEWEGKFTGEDEAVLEEYSESATRRAPLLDLVLSKVKDRFAMAPPGIYQVIAATDTTRLFGPRQVYSVAVEDVQALALPHPKTRVYLMGDAAHATTTHRGMGANTAIHDAIDLAQALVKGEEEEGGLEGALERWEAGMVARGVEVVSSSLATTRIIHGRGLWARHVVRPLLPYLGMVSSWGKPRELKR